MLKAKYIFILMLCLRIEYLNGSSIATKRPLDYRSIKRNISQLKDDITNMTYPTVKIIINDKRPACSQNQCKFFCINGKIADITEDINVAINLAQNNCTTIEELHLHSYEYPNDKIPYNFLGPYADKVKALYLVSSKVIDYEPGIFSNGIYQVIYLEDLQLHTLRRDIFEGATLNLETFTILQRTTPITSIEMDFLNSVKYQIRSLTIQAGLRCVRNITSANSVLNTLRYINFSHNNIRDHLFNDTFSQLSMVEYFDLSYSNITRLPEHIFKYISDRLQYVNLSNNQLTTMPKLSFKSRTNVKILLHNNPWDCSCSFSEQMYDLYENQEQPSPTVMCQTPAKYANVSVLDKSIICAEVQTSTTASTINTPSKVVTSTRHFSTTSTPSNAMDYTNNHGINAITAAPTLQPSPSPSPSPSPAPPHIDLQLTCNSHEVNHTLDAKNWQNIQWPILKFDLQHLPQQQLKVLIHEDDHDENDDDGGGKLKHTYGLIWFSKVDKKYQKMEINYKEYGLGCYGGISYVTTIDQLTPDMAYTVCLVVKDILTVSPFNCKSIHMPTNMNINYNAWLTRSARTTGISLMIFGIVMFTFLGILLVFLILKRKPTLLKGSKRIAKTNLETGEIVVFPKDLQMDDFRHKEQILAKRHSKDTINCERRQSVESIESNQSYMNINLYESIPAYLMLKETTSTDIDYYDIDYIPMRKSSNNHHHLVNYAQIPQHTKRTSSDPLPEIPMHHF